MNLPTLESLCDKPDPSLLPPPDRPDFIAAEGTTMKRWVEDGVVILPKFMPDNLIDAYVKVRKKAKGWERSATPYMQVAEIRDLCLWGPLATRLFWMFGESMAMHLNLCGWVSTERDWHQDVYLNPPTTGGYYVAIWFALEDIHPDSGPFEFLPGSHRGPFLSRQKVIDALLSLRMCRQADVDSGAWPHHSEKLLTPLYEAEIAAGRWKPKKFIASKGDILAWQLQPRASGEQAEGRGDDAQGHHQPLLWRKPSAGHAEGDSACRRRFLFSPRGIEASDTGENVRYSTGNDTFIPADQLAMWAKFDPTKLEMTWP